MKQLRAAIKVSKPATKIEMAEVFSVPEQSSSPKTRLRLLQRLRMVRSSDISIANVDIPLKRSSRLTILVKRYWKGEYDMEVQGTYKPA